MKVLGAEDILVALQQRRFPYHEGYLAMYSTWLDGLVTDPTLMVHPVDDHLVHRGDGVFETMKCVTGGIYNMEAHLNRLARSARAMHLDCPIEIVQLKARIVETVRAGGETEAGVRVILSRGPGSFGVNPYESVGQQVLIVVTRLGPSFMEAHPEGAVVRTSSVPAKPAAYADIKNCNYHPNMLMAREAVELGVDFVVSYDGSEFLGEGATENVGIVDADNALVFPSPGGILPGTTMLRLCELAEALVASGDLTAVQLRNITKGEVRTAREILVVGTTRNVTAVREYDGAPVSGGKPGPVWRKLSELLERDILENAEMRTEVFAS